jgi:hypothetical protein
LNDPFELPSLEEIQEMERQRSQAIESLQIFDSDHSVKCQRCGDAVPIIVGKMTKPPKSNRIDVLEKRRVEWACPEEWKQTSKIRGTVCH